MFPLPLNTNRSQRRQWLRAVRKSALPPEAKQVAEWVATGADRSGRITDPVLTSTLHEMECSDDGK